VDFGEVGVPVVRPDDSGEEGEQPRSEDVQLVELVDFLQVLHLILAHEGHALLSDFALLSPLPFPWPEQVEFATDEVLLVVVIERLGDAAEDEQYDQDDASGIGEQFSD